MDDKEKGGGTLSLLLVLFIGLKLTGVINWSWWWVLSPMWIIPAILFGLLGAWGLVAISIILWEAYNNHEW